jgi:glycosyltransferase involved in cell wall biosynthesis
MMAATRRLVRNILDARLTRSLIESEPAWMIFRKLPPSTKHGLRMLLQRAFQTPSEASFIPIQGELWEGPLLSVIVPCRNHGQYICDAIGSIEAQTFKGFEVIVVDDGSTDDETLRVFDELRHSGFTVLKLDGVGLAEARNHGILAAKGKYICCLDADDMLEPTYFEKCLRLLESNPGITFVYSHLKTFGDTHEVRLAEPFNLRTLLYHNYINATAIFRRDAWQVVGGFDPLMEGYEDWEFWIRLGKSGRRGELIPEILFNYRRHGHSLLDRSRKKHKDLVARIRRNNAELYSHPERIEEISRSYRNYVVSNPLLNLNAQSAYRKEKK